MSKFKSALSVVAFGLRILRWCGPKIFLSKMAHQIYGHTIFLVEENSLDAPYLTSSFKCTVSLATPAEVEELFREIPSQSREGRYQLLVRQWYHKRRFGDCYIARAVDTGEICGVRWLVTPAHIKLIVWEDRFPLEEDQVMMENSYTLEKYRRQGVKTAFIPLIREIARNLGFTRTRGYLDETNTPQVLSAQKDGDLVYARVLERHLLFRVTRKVLERYDPPVPVEAPPGIK